jgi:hypothetical protein
MASFRKRVLRKVKSFNERAGKFREDAGEFTSKVDALRSRSRELGGQFIVKGARGRIQLKSKRRTSPRVTPGKKREFLSIPAKLQKLEPMRLSLMKRQDKLKFEAKGLQKLITGLPKYRYGSKTYSTGGGTLSQQTIAGERKFMTNAEGKLVGVQDPFKGESRLATAQDKLIFAGIKFDIKQEAIRDSKKMSFDPAEQPGLKGSLLKVEQKLISSRPSKFLFGEAGRIPRTTRATLLTPGISEKSPDERFLKNFKGNVEPTFRAMQSHSIKSETKLFDKLSGGRLKSFAPSSNIMFGAGMGVLNFGKMGSALVSQRPSSTISQIGGGFKAIPSEIAKVKTNPLYHGARLTTEFKLFSKATKPISSRVVASVKPTIISKVPEIKLPTKYFALLKKTKFKKLEGGEKIAFKEVFSVMPKGMKQVPIITERALKFGKFSKEFKLKPKVKFLEPTARGSVEMTAKGTGLLKGTSKIKVTKGDLPKSVMKKFKIVKTGQIKVEKFLGKAMLSPAKKVGGKTLIPEKLLVGLTHQTLRAGSFLKTATRSVTELQKVKISKFMDPSFRLKVLKGLKTPNVEKYLATTHVQKVKQTLPWKGASTKQISKSLRLGQIKKVGSASLDKFSKYSLEGAVKGSGKFIDKFKLSKKIKTEATVGLDVQRGGFFTIKDFKLAKAKIVIPRVPRPKISFPKLKSKNSIKTQKGIKGSETDLMPTSNVFRGSPLDHPGSSSGAIPQMAFSFPKSKMAGPRLKSMRPGVVASLGSSLNRQMTQIAKGMPSGTRSIGPQSISSPMPTFGVPSMRTISVPKLRVKTDTKNRMDTRIQQRMNFKMNTRMDTRIQSRTQVRTGTRLNTRLATRLATRTATRTTTRPMKTTNVNLNLKIPAIPPLILRGVDQPRKRRSKSVKMKISKKSGRQFSISPTTFEFLTIKDPMKIKPMKTSKKIFSGLEIGRIKL